METKSEGTKKKKKLNFTKTEMVEGTAGTERKLKVQ